MPSDLDGEAHISSPIGAHSNAFKGIPLSSFGVPFPVSAKNQSEKPASPPSFSAENNEGRPVFTRFSRSMRRFPVVRRPDFGNQGYRQGSNARHQFGYLHLHDGYFVLRHFQNQFVVHLQHESAF